MCIINFIVEQYGVDINSRIELNSLEQCTQNLLRNENERLSLTLQNFFLLLKDHTNTEKHAVEVYLNVV